MDRFLYSVEFKVDQDAAQTRRIKIAFPSVQRSSHTKSPVMPVDQGATHINITSMWRNDVEELRLCGDVEKAACDCVRRGPSSESKSNRLSNQILRWLSFRE